MNKLIAGFALMFFLLSMLSSIMDGAAGAAASTNLTALVNDVVVIIPVTSTDGFLDSGGVLIIADEKILYTGVTAVTFTGCTRGYEETEAAAHADNRAVYNEDAGILNYAMGYQAIQTGVPGGLLGAPLMAYKFVTITVPKLVSWNFSFLQGDMQIARYALQAISIGFIMYLTYTLGGMALNMVRKVFP